MRQTTARPDAVVNLAFAELQNPTVVPDVGARVISGSAATRTTRARMALAAPNLDSVALAQTVSACPRFLSPNLSSFHATS